MDFDKIKKDLKVKERTCGVCKKVFTRKTALRRHLPCERGEHPCEDCGRVFEYRSRLEAHRRRVVSCHRAGNECSDCHREYKSMKGLKRHRCKKKTKMLLKLLAVCNTMMPSQ